MGFDELAHFALAFAFKEGIEDFPEGRTQGVALVGIFIRGDVEVDDLSRNDGIPGGRPGVVFTNEVLFQLLFDGFRIGPDAAVGKK